MDSANDCFNNKVDIETLPLEIKKQFGYLSDLKKKIAEASNQAYEAKEDAINVVGGRMSTKEALNNLQDATFSLAEAQVKTTEAQTYTFKYQRKLADTLKYLFGLGLTNTAMNRTIVCELEKGIREASLGDIDVETRKEINNLIKQLKTQQDLDAKQAELRKLLKEQSILNKSNEKSIVAQAIKDEEHDSKLSELFSIVAKQNEVIEQMRLEMLSMQKIIVDLEERLLANKDNIQ